MRRLTEANEQGYWNVKGLPWKDLYAGQVISEETRQIIYGCLCKLKDYEDIGPSPEQLKKIDELFSEVCKELGQLKQKVNDAGWIPCSDRLPEMHKVPLDYDEYYMISDSVLVTDGNGVFISEYEADDDFRYGWFNDGAKCENAITHWMPLPKPFREEKTNE